MSLLAKAKLEKACLLQKKLEKTLFCSLFKEKKEKRNTPHRLPVLDHGGLRLAKKHGFFQNAQANGGI